MRLLILAVLFICLGAEEGVPEWILAGIMSRETRSLYIEDGNIKYVNQKIGAAGERGPFQLKHIAWLQIKQPGERFIDLSTDMTYAQTCTIRYLLWLYNHSARHSWAHAIQYYNAGPGHLRYSYYADVIRRAKKVGYTL